MILSKLFPLLVLACHSLAAQDQVKLIELGQAQFQVHCMACHQPDHMLVGPSLVEVAGIYQKDPAGFIKWSLEPGKKRPEAIQMPSMAHVGEDNLLAIHAYILDAAKGKKEKPAPKDKQKSQDHYPLPTTRPLVQRMFLEGAGPAAIAVALPENNLNYAFDAASCRLRFVWQGPEFIIAWPYWKSNGNALVRAKGKVLYREDLSIFSIAGGKEEAPKFLGYTLDPSGIPTFRYRSQGVILEERITVNPDGDGLVREVSSDSPVTFNVNMPEKTEVDSETGRLTINHRW